MLGWIGRLIPEETIIEGIGNELLFVVGLVGLCIFVILAWLSTRVNRDVLSLRITLVPQSNRGISHETSSQNQLTRPPCDDNDASQVASAEAENNLQPDDSSSDELPDDCTNTDTISNSGNDEANTRKSSLARLKNGTPDEQREYASRFRVKGHLVLRLQYVNDRTRYVHASPEMLISRFKRKHFAEELVGQYKNVRLIFQGHELVEQQTTRSNRTNFTRPTDTTIARQLRLCDYNVRDGSTIHCLVTTSAVSTSLAQDASSHSGSRGQDSHSNDPLLTEFDMGARLLEPLFAFLLAFTWFFRIAYRQYFNSVSTFALITLSVFFCGAVFTMNFMNAASVVSAFAARRRNRTNDRNASATEAASTSSESGDVRVVTLTMATRRIQTQHDQPGSTLFSTETSIDNPDVSSPVMASASAEESAPSDHRVSLSPLLVRDNAGSA
ncbi:unnamed protein product [Dicrocoelium dendriticum]|nr:unnamed protein product [Dicrocoelium dendriticum]